MNGTGKRIKYADFEQVNLLTGVQTVILLPAITRCFKPKSKYVKMIVVVDDRQRASLCTARIVRSAKDARESFSKLA